MILWSDVYKSREEKMREQEIVIIPITKDEEKTLRGLYEKYDNLERTTGHPFIKNIATQKKFQIMELLGQRQR